MSSPNHPVTVLDATDNWWGTTDSAAIEELIYHQIDKSYHPAVDYTPFAESPFKYSNPIVTDTSVLLEGNVPSGYTPH